MSKQHTLTGAETELFCLQEQLFHPGDRVAVAISGGIDSTAVALLLQAYGCQVVGVVLYMSDCSRANVAAAKTAAERLGIELVVLDVSREFDTAILQYFYTTYQQGCTPSPCVHCNRLIKLKYMVEFAHQHNCVAVCTGHYLYKNRQGFYRAIDPVKDQSYFLGETQLATLDYCCFPLGKVYKSQIYAFMQNRGFDYFQPKQESQDLCFADLPAYQQFLHTVEPGNIVDTSGKVLGQHTGVIHYTIGQRRGLGIGGGEPLYVLRLDAASRRVIVGNRQELLQQHLYLHDVNILATDILRGEQQPIGCQAKIRYNSALVSATCTLLPAAKARIDFEHAVSAVAPGQWCALYADDRLLGGGWISAQNRVN